MHCDEYVLDITFINLGIHNINSQRDIRLLSHLLNTQPLECCEAARRQLVSIVTNTQLSITIVAPAKNLDKHKTILFIV